MTLHSNDYTVGPRGRSAKASAGRWPESQREICRRRSLTRDDVTLSCNDKPCFFLPTPRVGGDVPGFHDQLGTVLPPADKQLKNDDTSQKKGKQDAKPYPSSA